MVGNVTVDCEAEFGAAVADVDEELAHGASVLGSGAAEEVGEGFHHAFAGGA